MRSSNLQGCCTLKVGSRQLLPLVQARAEPFMYELVDNSVAIYQFTLILIFATALIFFVAMYWYSTSLAQTILEREQSRQTLKINTLELQRSQLQNEMLEAEKVAREERNLRLQQAIALKNQELVSSTMLLNEQARLMTEVGNLVKKIDNQKDPGRLNKLHRLIHSHNSFELQWENFRVHFEKVLSILSATVRSQTSQIDLKSCSSLCLHSNEPFYKRNCTTLWY